MLGRAAGAVIRKSAPIAASENPDTLVVIHVGQRKTPDAVS
jgi:hypothetical protein